MGAETGHSLLQTHPSIAMRPPVLVAVLLWLPGLWAEVRGALGPPGQQVGPLLSKVSSLSGAAPSQPTEDSGRVCSWPRVPTP